MADNRRNWRAALAFGLLAFALAIVNMIQGVPDCGAPLPAAMLDFELALTRAQFTAVLDCAPRLAALDLGNIVDLLLFMWAYGGLLTFFALAVGVPRAVATGLGVLIVGSDFVETTALRHIAAAWPALDEELVMPLAVAARVKFVGIAAIMFLTALPLWRRGPGARLVAGLAVAGAAGSLAIIHPDGRVVGTALITVAWLAMTIYAGISTVRARRAAQAAGAS